jgi:ABC-type branched-subunit amino acid transport system ATPase component
VEGSIEFSGSKEKRKDTCLIMQEDHLPPMFTVYETMTISANLKLGPSVSRKAKHLLIEDILDMMSLSICKDTRCKKLSGGQRKRLSIALELVSNPSVMFLDEPTTGLDSVSSLQCARVLKTLAKAGCTIVCTIHQPCTFIMSLLDHVYILCDGQCVYRGTSYNILPYLRQLGLECPIYHNPADFVMEVVCGEYGSYHTQLIQAAKDDTWNKSRLVPGLEPVEDTVCATWRSYMGATVAPTQSPNEFYKFCVLLKFYYIQLCRDWSVAYLKVIVHILVGGLIGLFFRSNGNNGSKTINNLSYLFLSIVYLSYTTLTPAVMRYPLERVRVMKEYFNNWYKLKTYYMAMTVYSIPVQLFLCLAHIPITYFLTAQPVEWYRFTMMLVMCFMCCLISEGFGILFGTLCNPVTGLFFGALYTAFLCLFGGFIMLFTHMPKYLYWMSYLDFYRFCYDGIITSLYSYNRPKLECPEGVTYCHLSSPEYILNLMGINGDSYWIDFGILLLVFVFIRFVAYCALKKLVIAN